MTAPDPKMKRLLAHDEVKSWRSVLNSYKALAAVFESEMQAEGLSLSRFQVMFHLYFSGPMKPVEVADLAMATRSNVSTFIKRMINDGVVRATSKSAEARRPMYELTPRGRRQFETIFPEHIARVRELMPALPSTAVKNLMDTYENARVFKKAGQPE